MKSTAERAKEAACQGMPHIHRLKNRLAHLTMPLSHHEPKSCAPLVAAGGITQSARQTDRPNEVEVRLFRYFFSDE
jgi:hypothetical protein